jgi:hypothetical protein
MIFDAFAGALQRLQIVFDLLSSSGAGVYGLKPLFWWFRS